MELKKNEFERSLTQLSSSLLVTLPSQFVKKHELVKGDTVNVKITKDENHFRSTGKNKTYSKSLTYHPNFGNALKWILKEKMNDNKDYSSLDSFFENFKTEVEQINNYIDEKVNSNS